MKIAILTTALLIGATMAQAQITKSGAGYVFRVKFTKGQTIKLNLKGNITMPMQNQKQPAKAALGMPLVEKVTSVLAGVATIDAKVGPLTMNGSPMSQQPVTGTVRVDNRGKVTSGTSFIPLFPTYPAGPVKVGTSWSSSISLSNFGAAGSGTVTASYKLLGMKSVNGKQAANVAVKIVSTGPQAAAGNGSGYIAASDGLPLLMKVKIIQKNPQGGAPVTADLTITRS